MRMYKNEKTCGTEIPQVSISLVIVLDKAITLLQLQSYRQQLQLCLQQ